MKRVCNTWLVALAAFLIVSACVSVAIYGPWRPWRGNATCSERSATPVEPASAFDWNERVREYGSITFRSWNGEWIGTDCDTDLTFVSDSAAHLLEYRDGIVHYEGTYHIEPNGEVTLRFENRPSGWPVMLLERDTTSLLLRPRWGHLGGVIGPGRGDPLMDGEGSFWPFRPVAPEVERKVQEQLSMVRPLAKRKNGSGTR
jgi:hypothetical protein